MCVRYLTGQDVLFSPLADWLAGFIDAGGFGAVYQATDLYTGNVVAVKVLHKGLPPHWAVETEELVYKKLVAGCSANIQFVSSSAPIYSDLLIPLISGCLRRCWIVGSMMDIDVSSSNCVA